MACLEEGWHQCEAGSRVITNTVIILVVLLFFGWLANALRLDEKRAKERRKINNEPFLDRRKGDRRQSNPIKWAFHLLKNGGGDE
jgi:hypothetical protein